MPENKIIKEAIILFAGDSGDGMQLTGNQFSQTSALQGNDISTFPDFPAEIRAPQGTISGVSGFQLHFSSEEIFSPGDFCDVLIAMNAAALKKNIHKLKPHGILIANSSGFDAKNLRLAQYDENPLPTLENTFKTHTLDITQNTLNALEEFDLSKKSKELSKNMYALGFVYWLYNKSLQHTENYLKTKFGADTIIFKANLKALQEGYKYGEITDTFTERYVVNKAPMPEGTYRNISGNGAVVLGLLAASVRSQKPLFFAGYPITPASDILNYLSRYKLYGAQSFQAEDEIAAISSAIGASFGGNIGVTASSGPGISLKNEAMGLAMMLEIPLIIINVQRGGPSTGLPTKTEQADLMQALFGRNGEAPIPIIAAESPRQAFQAAYNAVKMALEHNTPVILLSDGYIANGSEPWRFPKVEDLASIHSPELQKNPSEYLPYERNKNFVRTMAFPGTKGYEHVIGGLEKSDLTGEVSYNAENHQLMVNLRKQKIEAIADTYEPLKLESEDPLKKILVISWGSTFGSVKAALKMLKEQGKTVSYISLKNIYPLPKELPSYIESHQKIIVPELNMGQLSFILKSKYLKEIISVNKVQGVPFTSQEIFDAILSHL